MATADSSGRSRPAAAASERIKASWSSEGFHVQHLNTVLGGVAHLRGDSARAREHLRDAVARFAAADMIIYAETTRLQLGRLTRGDEGARLRAAADELLRGEGIVRPSAYAAMVVPGFGGAPQKG